MTNINVDVDANELVETPTMPDGTVVTFQVSGEPEIKESNANPGTHYLNISLDVIEAAKPEYIGLSVFHMISIPSTKMKKRMLDKNKAKGWKFVCSNWAIFCKILKMDKANFNTQRAIGKKFKGSVTIEEYDGRVSNKVAHILDAS